MPAPSKNPQFARLLSFPRLFRWRLQVLFVATLKRSDPEAARDEAQIHADYGDRAS